MEIDEEFSESVERETNREMTKEEFEENVIKPIRAAYHRPDFLSDDYTREFWYGHLRFLGFLRVRSKVDRWIRSQSKVPVLADIILTRG